MGYRMHGTCTCIPSEQSLVRLASETVCLYWKTKADFTYPGSSRLKTAQNRGWKAWDQQNKSCQVLLKGIGENYTLCLPLEVRKSANKRGITRENKESWSKAWAGWRTIGSLGAFIKVKAQLLQHSIYPAPLLAAFVSLLTFVTFIPLKL